MLWKDTDAQMHMIIGKEANLKILHAIWFQLSDILKKGKAIGAVKRSEIARDLEKEGRKRKWMGGFLEQWNFLSDTVMVDKWHHAFVITHGGYNTVNPNLNCGLS